MAFDAAHRNMPKLVNATVSAPPRTLARDRRRDADDLPLLARQNPDERALAVSLGVHLPPEAPPPIDELIGRPYQVVRGRALSIRSDLLTARKLMLAQD